MWRERSPAGHQQHSELTLPPIGNHGIVYVEMFRILGMYTLCFYLILRGVTPFDSATEVYIERVEYGTNNVFKVDTDNEFYDYYDDYNDG